MISTRIVGAFALAQALCLFGCSSSHTTGGSDAIGPTTTTTTGGGEPGMCGHETERCCSSGALCGSGLTCSDEFCLTCGPAPTSFMGCTNVAMLGTVTAATAPNTMADDPHKANDNDVCTSWNYGDYGNANAYWQVDLGSAQMLRSITLWPKMTPADGDVALKIQYKAADADPFSDYPTAAGLSLTLHDYNPWQTSFDPPITARFFRITIVNGPSFAALREVGLYAGCAQ